MPLALCSGTFVMEGSGLMVVTAVGLNSQAGVIMKLTGSVDKDGDEKSCSCCVSHCL